MFFLASGSKYVTLSRKTFRFYFVSIYCAWKIMKHQNLHLGKSFKHSRPYFNPQPVAKFLKFFCCLFSVLFIFSSLFSIFPHLLLSSSLVYFFVLGERKMLVYPQDIYKHSSLLLLLRRRRDIQFRVLTNFSHLHRRLL